MAFLEMYLNGEWKNLSSFGTVSSVDIQSSSSAITITGSPITSLGIINLSFNPSAIRLDQFALPTANLDINNKNLINLATPTLSHHATNKNYVDSKTWTSSSITDFTTASTNVAKAITLDQFAVPMALLSMNNYRITNVADPINPQDVATKAFVQASTSTISVAGAVIGTINNQGVINTSLGQYLPVSGSFINFDWADTGSYSSPYSIFHFFPSSNPSPVFNITSQTGSPANNSLRKWSTNFSYGSGGVIEYEYALSFYHSLIAGDHIHVPFRIAYSTPDAKPKIYIKAILDMGNYNIVNVPTPTASDHAANKNYIDSKTWTSSSITDFFIAAKTITLDQFAVPTSNINLNSNKIIGLATPTLSTDAASKGYVDTALGSLLSPITLTGDVTGSGTTNSTITTTLNKRLDQIAVPTNSVSLNNQKITSLATPTLSADAVNKSYVDSRTINDFTAPTANFSMNNYKITNAVNPVSAQDVATKIYVDNSVTSSGILKSTGFTRGSIVTLDNLQVRIASTGNVGIQIATVSGTMAVRITRQYYYSIADDASHSGQYYFDSLTTTFISLNSDNLGSDGSYYIGFITDVTNSRFYRLFVHNAKVGTSPYNIQPIVLERLI